MSDRHRQGGGGPGPWAGGSGQPRQPPGSGLGVFSVPTPLLCCPLDEMSRLETGTWESPAVAGTPPLPRTFHASLAAVGGRLYVFGGGDKGVEPVQDQQLHVFDTGTSGLLLKGGNEQLTDFRSVF